MLIIKTLTDFFTYSFIGGNAYERISWYETLIHCILRKTNNIYITLIIYGY
jgi:hypothetical protein